jgi:hypothetical protein
MYGIYIYIAAPWIRHGVYINSNSLPQGEVDPDPLDPLDPLDPPSSNTRGEDATGQPATVQSVVMSTRNHVAMWG